MTLAELMDGKVRCFSALHKCIFNETEMEFFRRISEEAQRAHQDVIPYDHEFYTDLVEAGLMGGEL